MPTRPYRPTHAGDLSSVTTLYLVDNSVFQRLPHRPEVAAALRSLATSGLFATCLPITLEAGHSAMSANDHARVMRLVGARRRLPLSDAVERCAIALQAALWTSGLVRAAGVVDLVIAAAAIVHGATPPVSQQPVR